MMARLRRFYWQRIRRHDSEICHSCGRPVGLVWWCFDPGLWERVTGNRANGQEPASGLRCIPCFDREAREAGAGWIEWAPLNLRHIGEGD
jgi:hypothetical protein